uniref:Uncharacterized protein n=1 Tax=Arundo donax TaxID=35708 RepID=A0A0A9EYV1_ARUDO
MMYVIVFCIIVPKLLNLDDSVVDSFPD